MCFLCTKGGIFVTVEELEIIVTAKVEEAIKEFKKIVPAVEKQMKQVIQTAQKSFSSIDANSFVTKFNEAIDKVKKKLSKLFNGKKSTIEIKVANEKAEETVSQLQKKVDSLNEKTRAGGKIWNFIKNAVQSVLGVFEAVKTKVNSVIANIKAKLGSMFTKKPKIEIDVKEAEKQISQLEKQIESLQEKMESRKLKLRIVTEKLDGIYQKTAEEFTPEGLTPDSPGVRETIDKHLNKNSEYQSLIAQEQKLQEEITNYSQKADEARSKIAQLKNEVEQSKNSHGKLGNIWETLKSKIKGAKDNISKAKKEASGISKISVGITNKIKSMR